MTVGLSPFAGAGAQFFTDAGAVLSGGKIYSYQAGTSTLTPTYTSSSGASQNTNPIILDSAGRLPAEIWTTTGASYKFVLKTSTDVLIGTYDNIPAGTTISGAVPWSSITGTPTTVAGYGITDALSTSVAAATYAPIASPAFTGTATAADAAAVQYQLGWLDCPLNSQTTSYALVLADRGKTVYMNGTSLTLTIPANASVAFPTGSTIVVINGNSSALTVAITADTLTLANSATTGARTLAQNGIATLIKVGATNWLISGNGVT
jgi:hypothetical protein